VFCRKWKKESNTPNYRGIVRKTPPCGYLSTHADGTIVARQSDILRLEQAINEKTLKASGCRILLTMPGKIFLTKPSFTHCYGLQGFVKEVALDLVL